MFNKQFFKEKMKEIKRKIKMAKNGPTSGVLEFQILAQNDNFSNNIHFLICPASQYFFPILILIVLIYYT